MALAVSLSNGFAIAGILGGFGTHIWVLMTTEMQTATHPTTHNSGNSIIVPSKPTQNNLYSTDTSGLWSEDSPTPTEDEIVSSYEASTNIETVTISTTIVQTLTETVEAESFAFVSVPVPTITLEPLARSAEVPALQADGSVHSATVPSTSQTRGLFSEFVLGIPLIVAFILITTLFTRILKLETERLEKEKFEKEKLETETEPRKETKTASDTDPIEEVLTPIHKSIEELKELQQAQGSDIVTLHQACPSHEAIVAHAKTIATGESARQRNMAMIIERVQQLERKQAELKQDHAAKDEIIALLEERLTERIKSEVATRSKVEPIDLAPLQTQLDSIKKQQTTAGETTARFEEDHGLLIDRVETLDNSVGRLSLSERIGADALDKLAKEVEHKFKKLFQLIMKNSFEHKEDERLMMVERLRRVEEHLEDHSAIAMAGGAASMMRNMHEDIQCIITVLTEQGVLAQGTPSHHLSPHSPHLSPHDPYQSDRAPSPDFMMRDAPPLDVHSASAAQTQQTPQPPPPPEVKFSATPDFDFGAKPTTFSATPTKPTMFGTTPSTPTMFGAAPPVPTMFGTAPTVPTMFGTTPTVPTTFGTTPTTFGMTPKTPTASTTSETTPTPLGTTPVTSDTAPSTETKP